MNTASEHSAPVRADKWLWAARFFKTRALATAAINGGKVQVNGERIKPGRRLVAGDRLTISKGGCSLDIHVLSLSARRGPAAEAQTLYLESPESVQRRHEHTLQRRLEGRGPGQRERRPDKRGRRQIHRFREQLEQ